MKTGFTEWLHTCCYNVKSKTQFIFALTFFSPKFKQNNEVEQMENFSKEQWDVLKKGYSVAKRKTNNFKLMLRIRLFEYVLSYS